VAFGVEERNPFWLAMARVIWGWVLAEEGRVERGLGEIRTGLDGWRATGSAWLWPCYLALLAEASDKAHQTEQALEAIDEALATVRATSEGFYESELHRLRGEFLLRLSPRQNEARAETECLQAMEIAQSQGARSLELRAATSLARLWRDHGRHTEAYDLLAPMYGWFTEGFETADLKDAKALLDGLR
jgi:predicted ATPase